MAAPTLTELLQRCARSAVHLETRDGYGLDDPMLLEWRRGIRVDPLNPDVRWRPWLTLMAEVTGRGVTVRRARIISEPVSEYIRFEYDVTYMNIAAGEQVRWLPRRQASSIALPGNDFWLIDGETVLINHFDGNGTPLFHEIVPDPDVVELCQSAFEAVWRRAVPHHQFAPAV